MIFNKMPTHVFIEKNKYFINSDFRLMINLEIGMQDISDFNNEKKVSFLYKTLKAFCPAFFKRNNISNKEISELTKKLSWFYKCGRENYHKGNGSGSSKSTYSYEYDDEYIYGAFYEKYNIDLSKDKVHWWKFMALIKSLTEDVMFEKIKGYRAYKGNDKDMKKLKEYWELPISIKSQEELNKTVQELTKYNKK